MEHEFYFPELAAAGLSAALLNLLKAQKGQIYLENVLQINLMTLED